MRSNIKNSNEVSRDGLLKTLRDSLRTQKNDLTYYTINKYRLISNDLRERVDMHTEQLMKELDKFCDPHGNINIELNTPSNEKVDLNSRLKLFMDIIGKDNIRENFNNVIKCGLLASGINIKDNNLFYPEDIVKIHENKNSDRYIILSKDLSSDSEKLKLQNLKDSSIHTTTPKKLLKSNPEYFVRYLKENCSKKDHIYGEITQELKEYASDSNKYSVYYIHPNEKRAKPYTPENNKDTILGMYINKDNTNMQPRLQILIDIIGTNLLGKKVEEKYPYFMKEKFSDEELNKYFVFSNLDNNLVKIMDENDEKKLYKIHFQHHITSDVIVKNLDDNLEFKTIPQSELLKLNPEYFKFYLEKFQKDIDKQNKLRKLGIKA